LSRNKDRGKALQGLEFAKRKLIQRNHSIENNCSTGV
jgi:hypothetical protein